MDSGGGLEPPCLPIRNAEASAPIKGLPGFPPEAKWNSPQAALDVVDEVLLPCRRGERKLGHPVACLPVALVVRAGQQRPERERVEVLLKLVIYAASVLLLALHQQVHHVHPVVVVHQQIRRRPFSFWSHIVTGSTGQPRAGSWAQEAESNRPDSFPELEVLFHLAGVDAHFLELVDDAHRQGKDAVVIDELAIHKPEAALGIPLVSTRLGVVQLEPAAILVGDCNNDLKLDVLLLLDDHERVLHRQGLVRFEYFYSTFHVVIGYIYRTPAGMGAGEGVEPS